MEELIGQIGKIPLYELYTLLLEKSGYIEALQRQKTMENQSRIENLQEFGNVIEQKESQSHSQVLDLQEFLEEMSLISDQEKTVDMEDCVTLMTLHNSKGLEFDTVFLVGMEEGLFPSFQSIEEANVEEERRLAYVGMTRAQERLFLTYARKRKFWGRDNYNSVSRFIGEIPEEYMFFEGFYKVPKEEEDESQDVDYDEDYDQDFT